METKRALCILFVLLLLLAGAVAALQQTGITDMAAAARAGAEAKRAAAQAALTQAEGDLAIKQAAAAAVRADTAVASLYALWPVAIGAMLLTMPITGLFFAIIITKEKKTDEHNHSH